MIKKYKELYKSNLEIIKKREAEESRSRSHSSSTRSLPTKWYYSNPRIKFPSNLTQVVGNNGIQVKGLAANNNLVF
jgi:hypothetical protein